MRNALSHVLALSLVALVGCGGESTDNNTDGSVNTDDVTNPDGTNDGPSTIFSMSAPDEGNFYIDANLGDDNDGDLVCDGTEYCDYEATLADGQLYLAQLDLSPDYLTVDKIVQLDELGGTIDLSWTGEGDYGLDIDWWCTDEDGDSVFIESYIGEFEDGSEIVIIDLPLGGNATILTGDQISGEDEDGSIYTGSIDLETASIHFEWWFDGELWKERNYTNCHE